MQMTKLTKFFCDKISKDRTFELPSVTVEYTIQESPFQLAFFRDRIRKETQSEETHLTRRAGGGGPGRRAGRK